MGVLVLPQAGAARRGLAWTVGVLGLAAVPLFWFGLAALVASWLEPQYWYLPLVPVLSGWVIAHQAGSLPPDGAERRWPGLVLMGLALVLAYVGNLVLIDDLVAYGMVGWIAGLVVLYFGLRNGARLWAPVAHLVLMVPITTLVYRHINAALDGITSRLGVWFAAGRGVLTENAVVFGDQVLRRSDAFMELGQLTAVLSMTAVFAMLYRGRWWQRMLPLLLAVPVAIIVCASRVAALGWAVERSWAAEAFLASIGGWLLALVTIALLALLAGVVIALGPREAGGRGGAAALGGGYNPPSSGHLVAAVVVTAAVSLAWLLTPTREVYGVERASFSAFPPEIAEWSGTRVALPDNVERTLGADDYISSDFYLPGELTPVNFFSAYYENQSGVHPPEVCLPADGWEIAETGYAHVAGEFYARRAIITRGESSQLVYYWFDGRGRRLTNEFVAKTLSRVDIRFKGRTDGSLVRFVTPILPGEEIDVAEERIEALLSEVLPILPRFIPR